MKKFIVLLSLVLVLTLSIGVSAKGFEAVGGVTYNSFKAEAIVTEEDEEDWKLTIGFDGQDGVGYFGGMRYWFNKRIGFGGGYELVNSNTTLSARLDVDEDFGEIELKEELKLTGPYAEMAYRVNKFLILNGAIAFYNMETIGSVSGEANFISSPSVMEEDDEECEIDEEKELLSGKGTGFIFGAELNYPLKDNFTFKAGAGYRFASIDVEEVFEEDIPEDANLELELKGLRVSGGFSLDF